MSKDIDFEFGRSIGATHYNPGNKLWYRKELSLDWSIYGEEDEFIKSHYEKGDNTCHFVPIPPEQWTIHNNDKPLCELSDEQAAQLFNAWMRGEQRIAMEPNDELAVCNNSWYKDAIYRIKQKSEREEFVEQRTAAIATNGFIAKLLLEKIFDAIKRGDIKAPEVTND